MQVYVITNPEDGWDCVRGVYKSFGGVKEFFEELFSYKDGDESRIKNISNMDELSEYIHENTHYIIHEEYLND